MSGITPPAPSFVKEGGALPPLRIREGWGGLFIQIKILIIDVCH